MQPTTTKLCSRCNTTKQLEEFGVNKNGVLAQCLACSAYNSSRKAAEREETVSAIISQLPSLDDFLMQVKLAKDSERANCKLLVHAKAGMTVSLATPTPSTSNVNVPSVEAEDPFKALGDKIASVIWGMTAYRWVYKDRKRNLKGFPGPNRATQYRYRCSQDRNSQRTPKKVADASKQRARKCKPCFDCKGRLKITVQVIHGVTTAKISLEHHLNHDPYQSKITGNSTSGDDSSEQDDLTQPQSSGS